jgi:hypothetical protein
LWPVCLARYLLRAACMQLLLVSARHRGNVCCFLAIVSCAPHCGGEAVKDLQIRLFLTLFDPRKA